MKYIGENAIKKLISLIKGDLATKQPTITASGLLKGDGAGTVTAADTQEATLVDVPNGLLKGDGTTIGAAVAGTDYVVPSTALEEVPGHIANKGNPHGVTAAQAGAIPSSEKGTANGVATLGADSKVPTEQLPEISAVKTFTATIGTTWTENEDTGVKSQNVSIPGVLAKHTAKVDHAYTGDGTSDGYAAFVEAENQYLTYITNGYAEAYDGGITFYIFGDANIVSIPIVVEVA